MPLAIAVGVGWALYALAASLFGRAAGLLAGGLWLTIPFVLGLGHLDGNDVGVHTRRRPRRVGVAAVPARTDVGQRGDRRHRRWWRTARTHHRPGGSARPRHRGRAVRVATIVDGVAARRPRAPGRLRGAVDRDAASSRRSRTSPASTRCRASTTRPSPPISSGWCRGPRSTTPGSTTPLGSARRRLPGISSATRGGERTGGTGRAASS